MVMITKLAFCVLENDLVQTRVRYGMINPKFSTLTIASTDNGSVDWSEASMRDSVDGSAAKYLRVRPPKLHDWVLY